MFDNNLYNLVNQLAQEHKSLWRIKNEYKKDAEGYNDCLEFWERMEQDKERHIEELKELIKKYLE